VTLVLKINFSLRANLSKVIITTLITRDIKAHIIPINVIKEAVLLVMKHSSILLTDR